MNHCHGELPRRGWWVRLELCNFPLSPSVLRRNISPWLLMSFCCPHFSLLTQFSQQVYLHCESFLSLVFENKCAMPRFLSLILFFPKMSFHPSSFHGRFCRYLLFGCKIWFCFTSLPLTLCIPQAKAFQYLKCLYGFTLRCRLRGKKKDKAYCFAKLSGPDFTSSLFLTPPHETHVSSETRLI